MQTINDKNAHPRDSLIEFDAGPHKYTCKGEEGYVSVTTWLHSHFKPFDADAIIKKMNLANPKSKYYTQTPAEIKAGWEKGRDEAAAAGTEMHAAIERYYIGCSACPPHPPLNASLKDIRLPETGSRAHAGVLDGCGGVGVPPKHFMDFVRDHPHLQSFRTEWMIFDEDVRIAGSIDMVGVSPLKPPLEQSGITFPSKCETDVGVLGVKPPLEQSGIKFPSKCETEVGAEPGGVVGGDTPLILYDWKRCKEIKIKNDYKEFALTEGIKHLPDTNFWHYALQLNTYKAILEAKYNKKIAEMWLVCLHPNLPTYQLFAVPDLSAEVAKLFALRKQELLLLKTAAKKTVEVKAADKKTAGAAVKKTAGAAKKTATITDYFSKKKT
jgi:hypothetical protein